LQGDKGSSLDTFPENNIRAAVGSGYMIENLFIFYANNSFRQDPYNLYGLIDEIEKCNIPAIVRDELQIEHKLSGILESVARGIIRLNKKSIHDAQAIKRVERIHPDYPMEELEIAFEAVFGYDNYCSIEDEAFKGFFINECANYNPGIQPILKADEIEQLFEGPNRLKCFECHQVYFQRVLDQIISGVEYDDIPGFINFIQSATDYFVEDISIVDSSDASFKKDISVHSKFKSPFNQNASSWTRGRDEGRPYKHVFNDIIRSLIAYSLKEHLDHNRLTVRGKPKKEVSRTKIGKCRKCGKYFIGSKANKEFCNDTCRLIYHSVKNVSSGANKEFKRMKRNEGNIKYL
jgi:hypothetical protein